MDYITSVPGQTKVGEMRGPVNPGSTATSPVVDPYEPGAPVLDFNKTINDKSFSAHRKMFSSWLVTNHDLAQQAWTLIKQCEAAGKTGANYLAAVAEYTKPPMGYVTADELAAHESAHYGSAAVPWAYDEWGDWGADQFQLAINLATLALAS